MVGFCREVQFQMVYGHTTDSTMPNSRFAVIKLPPEIDLQKFEEFMRAAGYGNVAFVNSFGDRLDRTMEEGLNEGEQPSISTTVPIGQLLKPFVTVTASASSSPAPPADPFTMFNPEPEEHEPEKVKCTVCKNDIKNKRSNLLQHAKRHVEKKQFNCSFCDYAATEAVKVRHHLQTIHPNEVPSDIINFGADALSPLWNSMCLHCFPSFAIQRGRSHTSKYHKASEFANCRTCVKCLELVDRSLVKEHILESHRQDCRIFACADCDFVAVHRWLVLIHREQHPSSSLHKNPVIVVDGVKHMDRLVEDRFFVKGTAEHDVESIVSYLKMDEEESVRNEENTDSARTGESVRMEGRMDVTGAGGSMTVMRTDIGGNGESGITQEMADMWRQEDVVFRDDERVLARWRYEESMRSGVTADVRGCGESMAYEENGNTVAYGESMLTVEKTYNGESMIAVVKTAIDEFGESMAFEENANTVSYGVSMVAVEKTDIGGYGESMATGEVADSDGQLTVLSNVVVRREVGMDMNTVVGEKCVGYASEEEIWQMEDMLNIDENISDDSEQLFNFNSNRGTYS